MSPKEHSRSDKTKYETSRQRGGLRDPECGSVSAGRVKAQVGPWFSIWIKVLDYKR